MKKLNILLFLGLVLVLSGCDKWLDLKPLGQVEADRMFEDEIGFQQTLTGSYMLLSSSQAYGFELTAGYVDEISQLWKEQSEFNKFDYKNAAVVSTLNATWHKLYEAIANTNLILDNIDKADKTKFDYFDLIKGEALGLRAYIHLDLLQLFGPVIQGNFNQTSIPYHENFSNQIVKRLTVKEVMDRIERDLKEAYVLLANDPAKLNGLKNADIPDFAPINLRYRALRMNYYAVCATLARFYLLKGDKESALTYANEIVSDIDRFKLLQREDIVTSKRDLMFSRELIFAIYDQDTENTLSKKMVSGDYSVDADFRNWVYEDAHAYGAVDDYRRAYWWQSISASIPFEALAKYRRTYDPQYDNKDVTPWEPMVSMIRLSELYLIAAEANLETDNAKTFQLINQLRASRNITPLPEAINNDPNALLDQIVFEYQKEFWGEGKLFYINKRLFRNIITREEVISASKAIYELPLPKEELEYGNN